MKYYIFIMIIILALACNNTGSQVQENTAQLVAAKFLEVKPTSPLDKYWYQGKAEVTRYELQQNRYRNVHPGEVILVQVTEDFLTDKQVKNDNYQNSNSVGVLKTNMIRRFTTGLYDYSIMVSVFTPTDTEKYLQTLKVTTSTQDWCGHTFMQLNWRNNQYQTQIRSYFENEADEDFAVPYAMLEDELFNRIRMNPEGLPTGKIKILPSLHIARLLHKRFQQVDADASLKNYSGNDFEGDNLRAYRVEFSEINRTLEIVFENESPYQIVGWTERYPSFDGQIRTTIAKRTNTMVTPYWQQNSLSDTAKRKELGVEGL